ALFRLDFLDLNTVHRYFLNLLISVPVAALVGYALYDLCRSKDSHVAAFIVSTIVFAIAPFILLDGLFAAHLTGQARYFIPLYIGVDLALVHLFYGKLRSSIVGPGQRRAWRSVLALVVVCRTLSCAASARADTWWNKFDERSIEVARVVNSSPHPLLMSDEYIERALSLSNYLDAKVALELRPRCYLCSGGAGALNLDVLDRSAGYSEIFLLGPTEQLAREIKDVLQRNGIAGRYQCIDDPIDGRDCASPLHLF
ncbi:MAG: hypothetical protein ACREM6_14585, partial [Vulcanimicrobiaceae bacterium]